MELRHYSVAVRVPSFSCLRHSRVELGPTIVFTASVHRAATMDYLPQQVL